MTKEPNSEIDQLRQQLSTMTTELKQALYLAAFNKVEAEKQHDLLIASQAREAKLRERMTRARTWLTKGTPTPECNWGVLDVSSEHFDDSALQELLKQERKR